MNNSTSLRITKLLKKIDIEDELKKRGYTGLHSGTNLMFKCFFHNDSNPSFGIAIEGNKTGLYRCLSQNCEAKGTFFNLIAHIDSITLEEVLRKFEVNFDFEFIKSLKSFFKEKLKSKDKKNGIKVLKESVLKKFKKPYGKYLDYLTGPKRKLNKETIEKFEILCCDSGKWKDRVVIPLRDERGRLISLTARHISTDEQRKKVRKLKNTDVSKILFGLNHVKKEPIKILVEGEFDCVWLIQNNVPAVSLGSLDTLTKVQIKRLVSCTEEVGLSFDGSVDDYILRKKRNVLKEYLRTKIIKLPETKDPNNLSEKQVRKIYKDYIVPIGAK